VSNDQSPPVRKVIPYKKGGRRPSPFAEMAFQFSGTALDVAIQQRAQEIDEELPTEASPDEIPPNESLEAISIAQEAQPLQEISSVETRLPPATLNVNQDKVSPVSTTTQKAGTVQKRQPSKNVSLTTVRKSKTTVPAMMGPDLQVFITRWKPFLTDTQIGICSFIYNNSVAIEREFCFTSTTRLMEAVSKTERQIKTVLNQLLDWEFLIKGETIVNAPREKRGTFYKLNLDKT
jgi:hypothetical protein